MKIFSIFTGVCLLVVTLSISAFDLEMPELFRSPILLAAQVPETPAGGQESKQPNSKTDDPAKKRAAARRQAEAEFAAKTAVRLLKGCRSKLDDVKSYQTNIEQRVRIGGREFLAKGIYYKGTGRKFRLELAMEFGSKKNPIRARLLQVCDGEILMTEQVVGKRKRYSRRNVKQILVAAAGAIRMPDNQILSELGLGGLIALIASLERTMNFDTQKSISTATHLEMHIEGGWKPAYDVSRGGERPMPSHVPDRVHVVISFPPSSKTSQKPEPEKEYLLRKIEYLKRNPKTKILEPMVTLRFYGIQLNPKLDEKLFRYVPKPGVFVEPTTDAYLRLFRPAPKPQKSQ